VTKNLVSGIISLIFGAVYLFMTLMLPAPAIGDHTGPKMFPILIGVMALVCGVSLVLSHVLSKGPKSDALSIKIGPNRVLYGKIVLTVLLGILYGLILDSVGYVISTFLFMLLLIATINNMKRMVENLIVSLGFSLLTYTVFSILLKLSLPRGLLSF